MSDIKITERGWPGHFICSDRCMFTRNTLIESNSDSVVVSTVGAMRSLDRKSFESVGAFGRYYETMVFGAHKEGHYIEANVLDERSFDSDWAISADTVAELPENVSNVANDMHEAVVAEFVEKLKTAKARGES